MKKHIFYISILVLLFLLQSVVIPLYGQIDTEWQKCQTANELIKLYQQKNDRTLLNDCKMILYSAQYILNKKGKTEDLTQLLKYIPCINLNHPQLNLHIENIDKEIFGDSYFMLHALKKGATFDEARDGISISTQFPERPLNKYDFYKLRKIFSSQNIPLQNIYLRKMEFMFNHHGCTAEMQKLENIIRKKCVSSPLKENILDLYQQYKSIMTGEKAPIAELFTPSNEEGSLTNYLGKLIIIDVWATWCCSCIEKMPKFIALQQKYQNYKDISFLTISIDQEKKRELWKKNIDAHQMKTLDNFIAPENKSSFCKNYHISGIPRYIVIDKKGKIITAYASLEQIEHIIKTFIK